MSSLVGNAQPPKSIPMMERAQDSINQRVSPFQKGAGIRHDGFKLITKLQKDTRLQMMKLVAEDIDVAEIYSPPRVTKTAGQRGLKGGWILDLTTKDDDGKPWDFSPSTVRKRAVIKINKDKPLLSVGSPMCTDWGAMMNINRPKMTAEEKARRMHDARTQHTRTTHEQCPTHTRTTHA